ncbi:iron-siderophore ABC transporter substrate-binding protein [Phyllobacterium zundukense]|jgi:iron complex transport system substrate-binding protein|uniref:Iron-siderophore ABC transporter substrate-binding protein n=1 Tax=Phyllobacterium zundukense TaxID=1867719 RepID=A0ACD4CU83_9HYPH|nr:iron-siderophore ABC transporter substrate-binding protein [Phyllobacterium zundukense]UXN57141.1 iron-siderophore ABC transporter substrate-binding protein [Phyllobacterium zundukense]
MSAPVASSAPRIVSLDYGLAQTLIELGVPPIGLVDTTGWANWTVEPALPPDVANLGSSHEINMELLQLLRPDLIVSTPYLEWVRPQLEQIAPVKSFPIHALGSSPFPHIIDATRELGRVLGRTAEAEALIDRSEMELRAARAATSHLGKVAVITFIDERNIRIYGPGGIFQDVFDRLGLENAWTRPTNEWGFGDIGMADLFDIGDARLFYMDPVPPDVLANLPGSPLWQSMPFVQSGHVQRMASVLMFGTLPAATRFARLLVEGSA